MVPIDVKSHRVADEVLPPSVALKSKVYGEQWFLFIDRAGAEVKIGGLQSPTAIDGANTMTMNPIRRNVQERNL
jgi:hypothetical protein